MRVGVNYPWCNCGWDFGPPPLNDDGSPWRSQVHFRDIIDDDLRRFRALGIFAVRWFIIGDGRTYGTGAQRPHPTAQPPPSLDDPPSLSAGFLADFTFLLQRFRAAGMLLLPSLIDHQFCFPGTVAPSASSVVLGGRGDILIDPSRRAQFFSAVLSPLLDISRSYADVIYAWELINEPEVCTRRPFPDLHLDLLNPHKTIPLDVMRDFLRQGLSHINEAGFLSTVGFLYYDSLRAWDSPGLGVTLHQFHYYGTPQQVPQNTFDPRWPCIVGEIATAPDHKPWSELGARQDVYSRLSLIQSRGYPVTFLWSAAPNPDDHDPAVRWDDKTRADLTRFLGPAIV